MASHYHLCEGVQNVPSGNAFSSLAHYPGGFNAKSSAVGGSQAHTHDLAGASGDASSLPPYYVLSFIMRCA